MRKLHQVVPGQVVNDDGGRHLLSLHIGRVTGRDLTLVLRELLNSVSVVFLKLFERHEKQE